MFKFLSNQKKVKKFEINQKDKSRDAFISVHFTFASQDLILNETSLKVELKQADGSIKTQDLIEFINEGKLKMSTVGCQKRAIMVLGHDGRGQEYTCQPTKRYTLKVYAYK